MGGAIQCLVGAGLCGGTQAWCRGAVGNGGWQARFEQNVGQNPKGIRVR